MGNRFILLHAGSLLLLLLTCHQKAYLRLHHGGRLEAWRPRRACSNENEERGGARAVRMPLPRCFGRKVSTHQSAPQLQSQGPLMNAWENLESFALLKKLIPGQFLDYIVMYSTNQQILSQRFLQFDSKQINSVSYMESLSKMRFGDFYGF